MKLPLLSLVGIGSTMILAIIGGIRYGKLHQEMKILFWFFVLMVMLDFVMAYMALNRINNHFLYHGKRLLEYTTLAIVLSHWQQRKTTKRVFQASAAAFAVVWLGAKVFLEDWRMFDNFTAPLSSMMLISLSCYTLVQVVKENMLVLFGDVRFWVVVAILLIHSTQLMLYAPGNLLLQFPYEQSLNLWKIHWIAGILANIALMRAFLCNQTRSI